jgi:murein L,D-transpeptidase YcbB/YkuD
MSKWRLAKSIVKLRDQINAAYPNRNKVSDGTVGDLAHRSRSSDHNPNSQGVVAAIDITHDAANGPSGFDLRMKLIKDARCKYVIFNGLIWKARTGKWENYKGANPHKHHLHLSVKAELADADSDWVIDGSATVPEVSETHSILKIGSRGPEVKRLQEKLIELGYAIKADSIYGNHTAAAVELFQSLRGLETDGIAGEKTLTAMGLMK